MDQLAQNQRENQETNSTNIEHHSPARFPLSICSASREEFISPIELTIRDGQGNPTTLPNDLWGHLFIIGPSGSPESSPVEGDSKTAWVTKDGWTPVYNGDGMIYRFSFDKGNASLKTRFVKPPCFHADQAITFKDKNKQYQDLAFDDLTITRSSLNKLGTRNQLNTAFFSFKLLDDKNERLLVTWDVGRPYEVDPETLETLQPVGINKDWAALLPDQAPQPFKQSMSSAHPVFDYETEEFFTVNVGKSIWTLLAFSRSFGNRLKETAKIIKYTLTEPGMLPSYLSKLVKRYSLFLALVQLILGFFAVIENIVGFFNGGYDFVHLMVWDGKQVGIKKKWKVVLPGNKKIRIDQTIHQMGLSKDYIVFAETSFKFSVANLITFQRDLFATSMNMLLSDFASYPQYPFTKLYIIKRADLKPEAIKTNKLSNWLFRKPVEHLPTVTAQEIKITPEFAHYIVDFDNDNNQIVLYIAHVAATDIAEYIRTYDRSAYDDRSFGGKFNDKELTCRMQKLAGAISSPMDVSRLGRWVIDGETGKVIEQQLVANPELTWSTAFYACPDYQPTRKYTDIFWNSWGSQPDIMTKKNVADFEQYPNRQIPINEVLERTYQGIPASLCHLKIRTNDNHQTKIEIDSDNYFQFNKSQIGTSAQFIPRPHAEDQTDGYIACVVLTSDELLSQVDSDENDPEWSRNSEIWIFDARKLPQGPLYKLSHPRLNIGFTIHTTWIAEAKSPERALDYDVREDHEYLVKQLIDNEPKLGDKIRKLFDEEIYPHYH